VNDAEEVHVEDMAPLVEVAVFDGSDGANAGVVDQEVDVRVLVTNGGYRLTHGLLVSDVNQSVAGYISAWQWIHVERMHRCTLITKARNGRRPDARGPASDYGHAAPVGCRHRSSPQTSFTRSPSWFLPWPSEHPIAKPGPSIIVTPRISYITSGHRCSP
jgi:hypothetical protein